MRIAAALLAAMIAAMPAQAQTAPPRTIDDMACPHMPLISPERTVMIVEPQPHIAKQPPASEADRTAYANWSKLDPSGVCWYREENRTVSPPTPHRVVFIGDSITQAWKPSVPALFTNDVIDRGVSGETTSQMLTRFRTDVLDLHPAVVHIMGGTNDIHSAPGTAMTRSNIESMVELARAHHITVILGAVTPSAFIQGAPDPEFAARVIWLNAWLKDYAAKNGLIFVDYHTPLEGPDHGMRDGQSNDGIHPNRVAFEIMTPLARDAIAKALRSRGRLPKAH